MEYIVTYNSASSFLDGWYYPATGIIISIVLWKASGRLHGSGILHMLGVCFKWIACAVILLTILLGIGFISTNAQTALSSAKNTCTIMEGKVVRFGTSPNGSTETFTVGDRPFKFSKYNITGGLNRSSVRGGPISEGLQVKLCYIRKRGQKSPVIVRVEVPKNQGGQFESKPGPDVAYSFDRQQDWTVVPVIDNSLTNNRLIRVPAFVQAVAYANAVARVCEVDVPIKVKMAQSSGMTDYLYEKHKAAGKLHDEPIEGGPVSYMTALRGTKLINRDGSAVKKDAATLCTPRVKSDLLSDLERIASGDLTDVDYVAVYLND